MTLDLDATATTIQFFFDKKAVEAIARGTKFVRRYSPLSGQAFLQASVFGFIENPETNLDNLAKTCGDLGITITPQGFDQRITFQAVNFLKQMLSKAMENFRNKIPLPLPLLQQFSAIHLTDSTILSLPDNMVEEYPGCGGDGSQASLKIQLSFEFLYGNLEQIVLQPGREPDQNHQTYLERVTPGSLTINDLGYFVLENLKTIAQEKQAYYLSRLLPKTGLLTPDGEAINLSQWLMHQPHQAFERSVLLGKSNKHQLPCRLICMPLPQEMADRRRQKAKERARRQRKTLSQEYLALLDWLIFVTNVPPSMLSMAQVALLYRVRWQIELVFKLWKSYCGLKRIAGLRRERVLFELYAKMIGITLTHFLLAPLRMPQGNQTNREISPVKVRDTFRRFARDLNRNLANLPDFVAVLAEMLAQIKRFGFKQKRQKNPNLCHALALAACALQVDDDQELQLPPL